MGKLFFMIFIALIFCSCANDEAGFDSKTKKEIMDSWAWKIFIFTDEGEFEPVETAKNKFDNTTKLNPIFVDDDLEFYSNDELFLNSQKEEYHNPIALANFAETKRKK